MVMNVSSINNPSTQDIEEGKKKGIEAGGLQMPGHSSLRYLLRFCFYKRKEERREKEEK